MVLLTPQLDRVERLVVFRALMLGDWLCATPALRALRRAMPQAHLVLCGLAWTAELARRLEFVDEFVAFPGHPALPERQPAHGELERFLRDMQLRRFDLALQMHGSGDTVNALVNQFGARAVAGFMLPGTEDVLDHAVGWPADGPEAERCLALTDALGAPRDGLGMDFPLADDDRLEAARLLARVGVSGAYAIVHPGSQLASRRWAPERFAAVADALAVHGLSVVLTGMSAEAPLAAAMRAASAQPLVDLTGRTDSLWTLGALVESARVVVTNDTGISHIAAALRTPSVVVASGSDVRRWAPLDHDLHRVHWYATPCRPCAYPVCPTAHECAAGVGSPAVIAAALDLIGG